MAAMRHRVPRTRTCCPGCGEPEGDCEICIASRPSALQKVPRLPAWHSQINKLLNTADGRPIIGAMPMPLRGPVVGVNDLVQLGEESRESALFRIEETPLVLDWLVTAAGALRRRSAAGGGAPILHRVQRFRFGVDAVHAW